MVATVLDMEGYESGTFTSLQNEGWILTTAAVTVSSTWSHKSNGHGGNYSLKNTGAGWYTSVKYDPAIAFGVIFRLYFDSATAPGACTFDFYFLRQGVTQCSIRVSMPLNTVTYYRGVIGATNIGGPFTWAYDWTQSEHKIEYRCSALSAGGVLEMLIDDVSAGAATSGNTRAHSVNGWDQIAMFCNTGGLALHVDDMVVVDATSGGDIGGSPIIYSAPPVATAYSTFTGGTTGYTHIDERPPSTVDNSIALAIGQEERYTASPGFSASAYRAVKVVVEAERDGDIQTVAAALKSGTAATVYGTDLHMPGAGSYGVAWGLWALDGDGNPWTQDIIAAAEFGSKVG